MKNLSMLLVLFFTVTGLAQPGWLQQNSGTNAFLFDVCFTDANNGWIAGNTGLILHTSNGGSSWEVQDAPPNNTYYSVFFVDALHGWAGGYGGKLIRTTDGGTTWLDGSAGTNRYRYDLFFINSSRGWVVGGDEGVYPVFRPNREIYYTADGGITWTTQYAASGEKPLYAVNFYNSQNGYAVSANGDVMRTTDGGANWAVQATINTFELKDVCFINATNGWIVGYYLGLPHRAAIFKSTDGGFTWNEQNISTDQPLQSICFIDESHGWAVGGNNDASVVLHTADGGENWIEQSVPTKSFLVNVDFVNSTTGWAAGANGTILKMTDIVSGVNDIGDAYPREISLAANYPNPFNPTTHIDFEIAAAGFGSLEIFDLSGQKVRILLSQHFTAGKHQASWNGRDDSGRQVASGVYIYRLQKGTRAVSRKMILLR